MGLDDTIREWFLSVALKKAIKRGVQLAVSYGVAWIISTPSVLAIVSSTIGGPVSPETLTISLTAGINSTIEVVRNWLKTKYPEKFGWL